MVTELAQRFALPGASRGGRFEQREPRAREELRMFALERAQEVAREPAVVRAGFDEPHRPVELPQPPGELRRQQPAEQRADGNGREEIAPAPD
jgi:hypothetical protein